MVKTINKFVTGNTKLNKITGEGGAYQIIGFGIPADLDFKDGKRKRNTCPGADHCREVCYAKQGMYRFNNVKVARQKALDATMDVNFVETMIEDLTKFFKKGINTVRVHDSGDFYSQEYLDKWYSIASQMPWMKFYAYTKALNLDLFTNKPDNFQIIQSLGGRWDRKIDLTKPHSRIFTNDEARIANGYVDGNINDAPAIDGVVKIGLVYHGGKNLDETQKTRYNLPVL
jgi:hypothetical protein